MRTNFEFPHVFTLSASSGSALAAARPHAIGIGCHSNFDIQNFVFLAIRLQQFWYRWKEEIHAVILSYSTSKSIYATTRYPQLTLGAPSFYLVVFKNKNKKSSKTKNEKSDQKVH